MYCCDSRKVFIWRDQHKQKWGREENQLQKGQSIGRVTCIPKYVLTVFDLLKGKDWRSFQRCFVGNETVMVCDLLILILKLVKVPNVLQPTHCTLPCWLSVLCPANPLYTALQANGLCTLPYKLVTLSSALLTPVQCPDYPLYTALQINGLCTLSYKLVNLFSALLFPWHYLMHTQTRAARSSPCQGDNGQPWQVPFLEEVRQGFIFSEC